MKKLTVFLLAAAMILSLGACKGKPSSSSSAASEKTTSSGSATPSKASSLPDPAYKDSSHAPSAKAAAAKNNGSYQLKPQDYSYESENNDFSVSYPQLSGLASNQDKVNTAVKTAGMKTVTSLAKKEKLKVKTSGEATYEGKEFLSVGFNEYVKQNPKAKKVHTLRTVNINLKTGAAASFSDLIKENDAFYAALAKAAKAQFSSKNDAKATAAFLKGNLDKGSMYFTDSKVGFALKGSDDGKLLRVTLGFDEVKPFVTSNEIWKNFI